ncbi:MerR family transcriptional regulator [Plantactinospora solaniradicis]|uniref:MerR family transcriptional regulator n=1 Tax=Plantactinospora solaniradicis TaxID=1723736 RepID=A0ABW1K124_9ACTN
MTGVDERTLYSIGDLARRTGLPVRTIRYYSDVGVLPPTDRSSANHRRYDLTAVARLDFIRTLRELGLDLATTQRVLAGEISVARAAMAWSFGNLAYRPERCRRPCNSATTSHSARTPDTHATTTLAGRSNQG